MDYSLELLQITHLSIYIEIKGEFGRVNMRLLDLYLFQNYWEEECLISLMLVILKVGNEMTLFMVNSFNITCLFIDFLFEI